MSFNTPTFILFLALAALLYYLVPAKWRRAVLLAESAVFYLWAPPRAYILIMIFVAAASWGFALLIDRCEDERRRARLAALGIAAVLSPLLIFKYLNMLLDAVAAVGLGPGGTLPLLAPVGVSFFTLAAIGYIVDVKRRTTSAERNPLTVTLFIGFFPTVFAGPICRAGQLMPQLREPRGFEYGGVTYGLRRLLFGSFKKLVLGDGLAAITAPVIASPQSYNGLTVALAFLLYGARLYGDFTGYSDMAIGAAALLGVRLKENFESPWIAGSMAGFWSRWHMSLTDWLRDYIYIPLGGNRRGFSRKLLNITAVFVLSGLWHGAGASYILWGLFISVFRLAEELIFKKLDKKPRTGSPVGIIYTFFVISLSWLFFAGGRIDIFNAAVASMAAGGWSFGSAISEYLLLAANGISHTGLYYVIFLGGIAAAFAYTVWCGIVGERSKRLTGLYDHDPAARLSRPRRWALYWLCGLLTAAFYLISVTGSSGVASFVYMGF